MTSSSLTVQPFLAEGFATTDPMAALYVPPATPTADGLAVLAGPSQLADGASVVESAIGGIRTSLWTGPGPARHPTSRPDVISLPGDTVLCLLRGEALLRLEPLLSNPRLACRKFKTGRALPARLFELDGTAIALFHAPSGATWLAEVDPESSKGIGERREGPVLNKGQTVSQMFHNADGHVLMTADDPILGFQMWREEDDGSWSHLIADGAARFGLNACVHDVCHWRGHIALAVGGTPAMRKTLFGMQTTGEILLLDDQDLPRILCGEMRPSDRGLLTPILGPANPIALERGTFTHLAAGDAGLIAVAEQSQGGALVYCLANNLQTTILGKVKRPIFGVYADPRPLVLVPKSR